MRSVNDFPSPLQFNAMIQKEEERRQKIVSQLDVFFPAVLVSLIHSYMNPLPPAAEKYWGFAPPYGKKTVQYFSRFLFHLTCYILGEDFSLYDFDPRKLLPSGLKLQAFRVGPEHLACAVSASEHRCRFIERFIYIHVRKKQVMMEGCFVSKANERFLIKDMEARTFSELTEHVFEGKYQ